ncbi:MAG: hypothetical protein NT007_05800 [Candidatus Kapabacteria bacterium]|nr:hypothetical protein [Candidatus Kapabacteria bacterium]
MAYNSTVRNYRLTDADLCMFTSNLCITMTRDLTDLTPFGITAPKIAALKALGDAFEIFSTDEVLVAYITGATEAKNAKKELVKETIRNMALRCSIKWGTGSWQEKTLGITGMTGFSDETLLVAARRVHNQMTAFLSDLTAGGLTSGMLDDFEDLNEELELAMNAQMTAVNNRDKKTVERIGAGNEIYSFVSMYCDIGKRVFVQSDPAKYNDYLIYDSVTSGLAKPTGVTANWTLGDTVVHLNWDTVVGATGYVVFSCAVDFGLPSGAYSSLAEYSASPQGVTFVADKRNYYKIKAKNSTQTSDYSDEAWTEVVISV